MLPDSLNIQRLRSTQKRLYDFLDTEGWINGDDIRQWISECVVHFSEVNVPQNIIQIFLERLEYRDIEREPGFISGFFGASGTHGPFVYHEGFGYEITAENRLTGKEGGKTRMTPIIVSFKVAENLIIKYEDELRLIPLTLIAELSKFSETQSMGVSLSAVQSAYEIKDSKKMLTALISTTDTMFRLIPELATVDDIGPKIKKAYETKDIYNKYSINREILWSLNNARIVRNIDIHTPNTDNETPIYEAVSYAHLLLLLILSIISSGELNLTNT